MVLGVLIPIAVLGLLIVAGAVLFNRGREGLDLAPRNLLRLYLYIASLAGIIVLVIGLSGILNAGFATAFGNGFVYGESPRFAAPCPPGAAGCQLYLQLDPVEQQRQQLDRRRAEDLIRGGTFAVFGLLFWSAHWAARRGALALDEGQSGIRRAYFMLGTVIFGLATIVLLPMGVYQAISNLILPPIENSYRPGAGESLAAGVVTLPAWLIYLWLVSRDFRGARAIPSTMP
ncbi:MAG TPA: hypothetical protein VHG53_00360 [Candidatus Limnocylindria bacterium]|nr:hypothetical protein [Candidatus Limnocylindria bacterium]